MSASEGTLRVNTADVRYVDVRSWPPELARDEIDRYFGAGNGQGFQGVAIAAPQVSHGLALSLAKRGIFLVVGNPSDSLGPLLEQFQTHLRLINDAGDTPLPALARQAAAGGSPPPVANSTHPRTESAYVQKPAHFDEACYREWMGLLSQSRHDEDAWKSDT